MKLLHFVIITIGLLTVHLLAETIYVSPDGNGDGSSINSPLGSFTKAVAKLDPGDEMILLDGEYSQTLDLDKVSGTASRRITIRAQNICKAFINGDVKQTHAVRLWNSDYISIDGILAGNTVHAVWSIGYCDHLILTRCAGFNAGYLEAQDGHVKNTYDDNCHIFGIAYSDDVLAEDVWAWGTGRYDFLYFQCTNSTVRRGVFRPTAQELGYGYDRCPHSGFNLYDCDNCIAENCIAFETRVHPDSDHDQNNSWGLVQGGMVFDDHTLPSGYNKVLGCFDLDNGQWRNVVARSNPSVHLMSKWSGLLEDVVIWKNALDYGIVNGTSGTIDLPTRALIGSPTKIKQNTVENYNLNHRYVNGELTDEPLWPWPYEEIIKELLNMDETITEYVTRMVKPYVDIQPDTLVEEPQDQLPTSFSLGDNYPNPFNPSTTIPFSIDQAGFVDLSIYDARGRKINTLVKKLMTEGVYNIVWTATDDENRSVSTGLYFVQITMNGASLVNKILLVR